MCGVSLDIKHNPIGMLNYESIECMTLCTHTPIKDHFSMMDNVLSIIHVHTDTICLYHQRMIILQLYKLNGRCKWFIVALLNTLFA